MEIDTKNLIQDLKTAELTIKNIELTIKNMIDLIKNNIRTNISEHPNPDIKTISKSPAICVVSLKHVKKHNNMSAEYCIPEVQAKMVHKYLSDAKTLTDLSDKINNLIMNGYVIKDKTKYTLHPNTISVLTDWQTQLE